MKASRISRPWMVLLLVGFWVFVGAFVGLQVSVTALLRGTSDGGLFGREFLAYLLAALTWIPLTPAVWGLASRFSLFSESWKRNLALHGVASLAFGVVGHLLVVLLQGAGGLHPGRGALELLRMGLASVGQWLHLLVFLYAAIVGLQHLWALQVRSRERELQAARLEAELSEAKLRGLRAQLRPHFLFNTLHTIGMLWRSGRGEEAQEMLERLSALLRAVLAEDRDREVPLSAELAFVEEYLAIEKVRFGERLRTATEVPAELGDARVPPFLLQPLVENAVVHGIEPLAGRGRVTVRARARDHEVLELEVEDDGVGWAGGSPGGGSGGAGDAGGADGALAGRGLATRAAGETGETGGVGLAATRRRLQVLYGRRGSLRVEEGAAGGTRVRVSLPLRGAVSGKSGGDAEPSGGVVEETEERS